MNNIKKLISKPLFLPIFCMLLVMAVNIIYDVASGNFAFNFFTISIRNGVLYGRIIDILNRGSEIAILAIGMTLVVSCSAGTDISVGSVMSLAASFCCMLLAGYGVSSTNELARPLIIGVLGGILIGCVCGAFNGFLVSYLNVQPMVATLILFSAARPNRQRQSGLRRKSPAAVQSVDLGPCWHEAERRREPRHANGRAMTRPAITTENCWAAVPKRTATPIPC